MLRTLQITTLALIVGCATQSLFAQGKGKRGQQMRLFSPQVTRAVPGIGALASLNNEQRKQIAVARKASNQSEALVAARKTLRDKSASRKDKRQAKKTIQAAQNELNSKIGEVVGGELSALVKKINAAASEAQKSVRSEFQAKLKEAKGDKEGRKKLQKEIAQKTTASIREKVLAVLSDEQKETIANAKKGKGKKRGGGGKKTEKKPEKKEKPEKENEGDAAKESGKKREERID